MSEKFCIVATIAHTGQRLESFIRYHLSVGFSRLYLFFDQPNDEGLEVARRYSEVVIVENDNELHEKRKKQFLYRDLGAQLGWVWPRQHMNVETAIELARADGMQWILHIDDDEIIYSQNAMQDFFAAVPADIDQVTFFNHEAAPESFDVQKTFEDVTLFKNSRANLTFSGQPFPEEALSAVFRRPYFFLGYEHGKSAARLSEGLTSDGAHRFRFQNRPCRSMTWRLDPAIYHFNSCRYIDFHEKYRRLYDSEFNVPDRHELRPPFVTEAKALFQEGRMAEFKDLFARHVIFQEPIENETLLRADLLHRNTDISRSLKSLLKS